MVVYLEEMPKKKEDGVKSSLAFNEHFAPWLSQGDGPFPFIGWNGQDTEHIF